MVEYCRVSWGVCSNAVSRRHHALECDSCRRWIHRLCGTGMSQAEYREILQLREDGGQFAWKCRQCSDSACHTSGVPAAVADTGDFEESVVDVGPPLDSTHVADDDCAAPAVVDISSIGEGDDSRSCHIDTDCNEEQVSFVFY